MIHGYLCEHDFMSSYFSEAQIMARGCVTVITATRK